MPELAIATAAETPIAPMSLKEHIAAEERVPEAIPTDPPAPVVATPVAPVIDEATTAAEADSTKPDADLSEAARKMRASRLDVRKAKLQDEINELNEKLRIRKELRAQEAASRATQPTTTPGVSPGEQPQAVDPSDPEPTLERFIAANPAHPDPYAGWQREVGRWDRRQEQKAADAARQRQQTESGMAQAVATFSERATALRASHSDFDAVVNDLVLTPAMQSAILGTDSGPALAYHLAKHPELYREIATAPPALALYRLGQVGASLATPPKETPPPVTKAPTPPAVAVGGSAAAVELDTRKGVPLKDHIRIEEAEIAERRARGYRN